MSEFQNIMRMERARTGNYGYDEEDYPKCPVCAEEYEYLIEDINGDVVGCDCCCCKKYA